jgi:hypothetical protein
MGYHIDLKSISLNAYKEKLRNGYLPPSRRVLKEKLDERFEQFQLLGISNVHDLKQWLSKDDKLQQLIGLDNLPISYLKILLREIKSIQPKPNKLKEFQDIDIKTVSRLEHMGITNTRQLFDHVRDKKSRQELAAQSNLNLTDIEELTRLCDLSRIKWVGTTFARMLYQLGIDSVSTAANTNPVQLHEQLLELNREHQYYKGQIGLNDIHIFVEAAREVPVEIVY